MKKVFLSMAAFALVMASCSKEEVPGTTNPDGVTNAVAIKIGQTVKGLETKAPVVNSSEVDATVLMHDASGASAEWSKFSAVYQNTVTGGTFTKDADRATVSTATFTAGTKAAVTLAPTLYYPVTGTTNHAFLAAVSPKGTVEGQTVKMASVDGEQDVMYAPAVDFGVTPTDAATAANLEFAHKTTQLIFKMKMTAASSDGEWGGSATLKSISLVDGQLPTAVNFTNGEVSWTTAAPVAVPGISNSAIATTDAAQVGNVLMVKAGGVKVNVEILAGGKTYTYNDVEVMKTDAPTTPLVAAEGSSHTITLSVTEPDKATGAKEISATATVTEWKTGDAGSADLK